MRLKGTKVAVMQLCCYRPLFSCSLIEYQTSAPKKFVSLKKGPVPGPTKGVSESVCVNADRFFIRDLLSLRNL